MAEDPASNEKKKKSRSFTDLLLWLILLPLVVGTLACFGQLALILLPQSPPTDTQSRLDVSYKTWPYDLIKPVNVNAFIEDIEKENNLFSTPEPTRPLSTEVYWVPPTPTAEGVKNGTPSPHKTTATITPTIALPVTRTVTAAVTRTPTRVIPSFTPRPTSTTLPTITPTLTRTLYIPPIDPTLTNTNRPPRPTITKTRSFTRTVTPTLPKIKTTIVPSITGTTKTITPTGTITPPPPTPPSPPPPPATLTMTPTRTRTVTPTRTMTLVTPSTITPTPTPTYAPIRPIAENNGISVSAGNGGCKAYFGYSNDNPQAVDIAAGSNNQLDDPAAQVNPPQPTHFQVGRVLSAFEYTWYSGQPLNWFLDGRQATANWCGVPPSKR